MFVPGLNGSSLGGELPLDPFFFFWFLGVVKEGELLDDKWEGFTVCCCCELFGPLLFSLVFFWAHWMSSVASYLAGLHTFKCCDLCCLEELPVHLRVRLVCTLLFLL